VTAIHPGYGFLSENEEFCAAVEGAGIQWLGPSAQTLHDFALKHVARKIAEAAGVSEGVPGARSCIQCRTHVILDLCLADQCIVARSFGRKALHPATTCVSLYTCVCVSVCLCVCCGCPCRCQCCQAVAC
jgi:hypothetical protein